ncbi:hypothetical protein AX17_001962 [Amanita inopinata Kibby_2008]|nr:hypothetical protein AX17_001962 [Amanita inopinata Kibby_2008]
MTGVANVQDVLMLFGDSITQGSFEPGFNGFGQRLAHVYARRLDVLNRGLSGYNTDWAVPVLQQCLAKRSDVVYTPKIRLLVIWFGANDAAVSPSPQHVPLHRFIANLHRIISLVRSAEFPTDAQRTHMILITPPPINTYQRGADLTCRNPPQALDRTFETTREYAKAVKRVAATENVAVVDLWTAMFEAAGENERNLSKFLIDGLHPNEAGYKLVYDELINTIRAQHPDVYYENIPFTFRPWGEINVADTHNLQTSRAQRDRL